MTGAAAASAPRASSGGGYRFDRTVLFVLPAAAIMVFLFIYPFLYGFLLSFNPSKGGWLANYERFFSDSRQWRTIITTFQLAIPATLINVGVALPIAFRLRNKSRYQRLITTILVIPITLGTVLIAEGMLFYFGPKGWLVQSLQYFQIYSGPIRLTNNFTGVVISLVISGFPFAFLLILSYVTGIDPTLARAAATLGANRWNQFRHIYLPLLAPGLAITFCLAFVQAYSVFPSAVMVGQPAGSTRVISLAAYEAAYEEYNYSFASTVAMVMGFTQLSVVVAVLMLRQVFYRGPVSSGKG